MVLAISKLKLYQLSESTLEKEKEEKEKKNSLSYCSHIKFQENSLIGCVWITCLLLRPITVAKRWQTVITYYW